MFAKLSNRAAAVMYTLGFIIVGFVFNSWSLHRVFGFPDPSGLSNGAMWVGVFQTIVILGGIAWVASGPFFQRYQSKPLPRFLLMTSVCLGLMLTVASVMMPPPPTQDPNHSLVAQLSQESVNPDKMVFRESADEDDPAHQAVKNVFISEEMVVDLAPLMSQLSKAAKNLQLLDEHAHQVFHPEASFWGQIQPPQSPASSSPANSPTKEKVAASIQTAAWPVIDRRLYPKDVLWDSYFQNIDYLKHAKFYFIKAHFDLNRENWYAEVGFKGLAKTPAGQWQSVQAHVDTVWQQDPTAEKQTSGWQITSWKTKDLETEATAKLMFQDVVDTAIPDVRTRKQAVRSLHTDYVIQQILQGGHFRAPYHPFSFAAIECHPGIAVVDINQDGFDDIYLMEREETNQLLINQRNGTFREETKKWGLDIEHFCSSAIFFDADNDGDLDVFIGRNLQPSLYLVNHDGKFVEAPKKFPRSLPRSVSSVAVADYDNDGLLDIYVSTYDPYYNENQSNRNRFLRVAENREPAPEVEDGPIPENGLTNRVSVPNVLFHNVGDGKFEIVENSILSVKRMTYQSTWGDYDDDGDQDLFCANDFGPDYLFRNNGNGDFENVTRASGMTLAVYSLSMGASWGDYNNDGRLDLYISGMYSKAGKRVMNGLDGEDPTLLVAAEGSTLFRHDADGFHPRIKGKERKAGWSWGGQFTDIDNDGDQDIYVVNGFYTAPPELALPGDG